MNTNKMTPRISDDAYKSVGNEPVSNIYCNDEGLEVLPAFCRCRHLSYVTATEGGRGERQSC